MNKFGSIIQFMFFIIVILVMAKIFGFADSGFAVLAACGLGGLVYLTIYLISLKVNEKRERKKDANVLKGKSAANGGSTPTPVNKAKKKNPNKKKSGTAK